MKVLERIKREFHWTRLLLRHRDWRTVAFTPWLPYNCWQVVYLVWRWFVALYFIAWFIAGTIEQANLQALYLIYLTNWGIMTWVIYVIVAALVTTVKFCFLVYNICKSRNVDNEKVELDMSNSGTVKSPDSNGDVDIYKDWRKDSVSWYLKIFWILFNIGPAIELAIGILYFAALYDPSNPIISPANDFNLHLTPAVIGLVDVWVAGVIMNVYHVYMPFAYGVIYGVFTLIYFGAGGLGPTGRLYIYPIIDYGGRPGLAAGVLLGCCLVYIPLIYLVLYCMSLPRRWLVSLLRNACYSSH